MAIRGISERHKGVARRCCRRVPCWSYVSFIEQLSQVQGTGVKAALTRRFGGGTAAAVVTAKQDFVDESALLVAFEDPDAPTEDYDGFIRTVNQQVLIRLRVVS
eukprot:NODE_6910_length_599_cov_3.049091_g5917_i0.p1 GENE.NODE_6910_length_599_cov_3.049091_g5917_i0~~NODE_6910_length_599_cov_3.049091_g5917_i0.p1  ORF type:complete len:104 (+),score=5.41 NODE_6910_length_599_cov_3.049091_g5917_i0:263-574(+)